MHKYCQVWLTCKDKTEADKVAKILLEKKLAACARQVPITSDYRWQDKIEHANEVLLMMESREDLFNEIEREVAKLHSYNAFVLEAVPVSKISKKAKNWLTKELRNG